jgi:membrane protease YdiL (CAAX protease family)
MTTAPHDGSAYPVATAIFVAGVAVNVVAWQLPLGPGVVAAYHFLFGVGLCVVVPTWYAVRIRGWRFEDVGLASTWRRDVAVGSLVAALTVPWRLPALELPSPFALTCLAAALAFSALFEEMFFRGFLQSVWQRAFGTIPAILVASVAFALYHVGYGEQYRRLDMLTTLTLVGVMLGTAFRLTNSVWTSITLNWPHAMVTFIERGERFDRTAALASIIAIAVTVAWLWLLRRVAPLKRMRCGAAPRR